jgi:uncharacterized protein YndB with AHSA1/START domain
MKAIERTEQLQQRDIDIEYEFSQSPAQIWRVLSEPELLAQWLLPNDIAPEVGKHFNFGNKSSNIECEVLASEPEHLLSYSWRTEQSGGDLDTVVTFVLTETADGGTHLRLIHTGFPQPMAQIIPLPHSVIVDKAPAKNSAHEVKLLWAA